MCIDKCSHSKRTKYNGKGDIKKLMKLEQCENVFDKAFQADVVTGTTL